ncbi:MAG: PA14 domain-containing protein, partial [Planctomycetota bacterium]
VARGTPPVIKATGFTRGKFISIDRSNGDILVAGEWDGPVYRYDRNYQLKATYGRVGGRQQGPYNPEDFCALHDLASDNRGGFLVVENWSAPRRLAHFGPDGKLIKEWCGGQLFFTGAAADPTDPRRVWINSHWGWLMEVEADYDAHTWKTRATYCLAGLGEGFVPDGGTFNRWTLRRHGEHRYLIAAGRAPCVLLVDDAKRRLLPLVIAGSGEGKSKVVHSVLEEANKQKPAGGGWYGAFLWQERNDNGQIDAEEVRPSVVNGSGGGPGGGSWSVDADMTFYHWQTDKDGFLLYRLPVKEWVGARPVYPNWDDVTPVRLALTPEQVTAHKTWWGGDSLGVAPNGDAYMQVQGKGYEGYAMQFWAAPAHSSLWPNNMIGEAALCKWSPSKGGLEWRVGRLSTSWAPTVPGTLNSRAAVLGQVHGCMLFSSRVAQPMEAWTEDGLYAGAVFDRRAADGHPGAYYSWWRGQGLDGKTMDAPIQADMLMGGGMAPMPNGAVLFFGCGWNNVPVYRVTGWDSFHRQSGRVELKKPPRSAAGTGTGLYGEFFTEEEMKGEPVRRRITPRLWVGGDYWPKTDNGVEAAVVRWTGSVEARFSEDYQLKTYTANDRVRIWLADRLILDSWSATNRHDRTYSGPVPLKAGEKTPIRIEYAKMGKGGDLHVCWESASQEIEHIPHPCLYPPEGAKADPEPAASPPSTGPSLEKYLIDLKQEDTAMPKDLDELLGPNGSPE